MRIYWKENDVAQLVDYKNYLINWHVLRDDFISWEMCVAQQLDNELTSACSNV